MTARLPSLNGLRAFEAAGRHLSFKAAATELSVTPGAVIRRTLVPMTNNPQLSKEMELLLKREASMISAARADAS